MKLSSALLLLLKLQSAVHQSSSTDGPISNEALGHDAFAPRLLQKHSTSVGSNRAVEKVSSAAPGDGAPVRAAARRNLQTDTIRASKVRIELHGEEYLHLQEVEVIAKDGTNVALIGNGGSAQQSSVDGDKDANLAINGIPTDLSHTDYEQGAWLEVQLDNPYDIKQVNIYNWIDHDGCFRKRLSNSVVSLWDGDTILASKEIGDASSTDVFTFAASEFVDRTAPPIRASKVRIQLYGKNYLNLREVEVIDKDGTNVALAGIATQSSTYEDPNYSAENFCAAELAIDGLTCSQWDTCLSHTEEDQGAWLEVQLDNPYDIKQVKIYNRIDLRDRLSNSVVSLWDGDTILASHEIGDASRTNVFRMFPSEFTPVPWKIEYSDLRADFAADSDDEFEVDYLVAKDRPYRHYLYQKDCRTDITDIDIDATASLERQPGSYSSLSLAYNINRTAIGGSSIWNKDAKQIEICQVVQLTHGTAADPSGLMVIVEDFRNVTVGFNLTSGFSIRVNQTGLAIDNRTDEVSLAGFVVAFHCNGALMVKAVADLGPNDVLHVCIKTTSTDVVIKKLNNMEIRQGSQTLPVVVGATPSIPAITTREYLSTGVLVSTRVPANVIDYETPGASIVVGGDVTLGFGDGSERKLRLANINRELQADGGDEDASFEVDIGLQADSAVELDDVQALNFAQVVEVNGFAVLAAIATAAYAMW